MQHHLNLPQKEAVNRIEGATLVVAGAGCGKTRVIISRIEQIAKQVPEKSNILALTFTNKAAKEMLERIHKAAIPAPQNLFIGTFHSFCFSILKKYANDFELNNFGILDSTDQQNIVKKILEKYGLSKELQVKNVLSQISLIKNSNNKINLIINQQLIQDIFLAYEKEKNISNNLDFDDLLILVHKKLKHFPIFVEKLQKKIDHILIDEYQDTNNIQHEIVKLLAHNPHDKKLNISSIFAVGDQDQSIYSWRGATPENINLFLQDFAPAKLIKIEQNYRSAEQILKAANSVIDKNSNRTPKKLWSENNASNCIFIAKCKNEYQEADIVANTIKEFIKTAPNMEKNCAILYRNHYQSRVIEEALITSGIKYKIIGGIRFYERKEIKDILAYLKLINNFNDLISLERIINCPPRGLGDKFLEKLNYKIESTYLENKTLSLKTILSELIEEISQEKGRRQLKMFLEIYEDSSLGKIPPSEAISKILEKVKYYDFLEKEYESTEAEEKKENIEELIRSTKNFSEKNKENNPTIKDFLEEIALIQEIEEDNESNSTKITTQLMTLHGAKGLEFNFVSIIGLEEKSLPSNRKDQDLEEERRLFYVGVTRAKDKLLLSFAEHKSDFGRFSSYEKSRFLNEIPNNLFLTNQQNNNSFLLKNELNRWLLNQIQMGTKTITNQSKAQTFNRYAPSFKKPIIENNNLIKPQILTKKSPFFIEQKVQHPIFGYGIIKNILIEGDCTILEIKFNDYTKKINSLFIKTPGN